MAKGLLVSAWAVLATTGCSSDCIVGTWNLDVRDSSGQLPSGQVLGLPDGSAVMLLQGGGQLLIDNQTIDQPALMRTTADGKLARSVVADHPGPGYLWAVTAIGTAIVTWNGSPAELEVYNPDGTTRSAMPLSTAIGSGSLVGADVADNGEAVLVASSTPANPATTAYTVELVEPITGAVRWSKMFAPSTTSPCGQYVWVPLVARADNGDVWLFDGSQRRRLAAANGVTTEMVSPGVCLTQLYRDGSGLSIFASDVTRTDTKGTSRWTVPGGQTAVIGSDLDVYTITAQSQSSSSGDFPDYGPITVSVVRLDGMTGAVRAQRHMCVDHANAPAVVAATASGLLASWVQPAGTLGVPFDHTLERYPLP